MRARLAAVGSAVQFWNLKPCKAAGAVPAFLFWSQEKRQAQDSLVTSANLRAVQVPRGQYKTCPILTLLKQQHSCLLFGNYAVII